MAMEDNDSDDRTIFVGGLSDKMTDAILYELFFQAGPIERVSIPTDKEGRIKTFGFVEYKHLISVDYALHLFAGTRLFGRELMLRNRSSKGNQRNDPSHHIHPSMSLMHGANPSQHVPLANELNPTQAHIQQHQQQLLQQQLLLMATGQNIQSYMDASAKMFNASSAPSEGWFASTRTDRTGSHREHFVERRRDQRDDSRTSRSNPYRRSRSRSPNRNRDHDNSPLSSHQASRQSSNDRNSRKPDDGRSNYHRWGRR